MTSCAFKIHRASGLARGKPVLMEGSDTGGKLVHLWSEIHRNHLEINGNQRKVEIRNEVAVRAPLSASYSSVHNWPRHRSAQVEMR